MILAIRRKAVQLAWPTFPCEDCISVQHYGCWCANVGGEAPGVGPSWWRKLLRRLL